MSYLRFSTQTFIVKIKEVSEGSARLKTTNIKEKKNNCLIFLFSFFYLAVNGERIGIRDGLLLLGVQICSVTVGADKAES